VGEAGKSSQSEEEGGTSGRECVIDGIDASFCLVLSSSSSERTRTSIGVGFCLGGVLLRFLLLLDIVLPILNRQLPLSHKKEKFHSLTVWIIREKAIMRVTGVV